MTKKMCTLPNLIVLLFFSVILLAGCAAPPNVTPPPDEDQTGLGTPAPPIRKPGDYFPLTRGSSWKYLGEGNEYASFNRVVLFTKEDRAQIKWDNGGTVGAAVFETTNCAVTRIFMQGEEYEEKNFLDTSNEHTIILKAPLEVGTSWEDLKGGVKEIVDINAAVTTPAGTFENCVKVKTTGQESTIYDYYKEGVGMVKSEFISGDTQITSSLQEYSIADPAR